MPPAQQRLWPLLRPATALGFVLYGGTAIALHLGHRASVDFDFFTEKPLNRDKLFRALPFLTRSFVHQDQPDVLCVWVPDQESGRDQVKLSFFGTIDFGRIEEPYLTADQVMQVASLDDLMATKVKVVLQRVEVKDYQDIAAMVRAGVDLSRGIAAARQIYGSQFQPSESLKALTYFEGGDLHSLSQDDRHVLINAVNAVRDLPEVTIQKGPLGLASIGD